MATSGENCNDWPVMTKWCLLMAFTPDGATGNDGFEELPHLKHNVLLIVFGEISISKQFIFAVFKPL